MRKRKWKATYKLLSVAMLFVLAITLVNPLSAQAKTKTLKLPWGEVDKPYESYVESVAKTVTKKGTYKIKEVKKSFYFGGFVKFIAPKTKKYTFTFSDARAKGKSPCLAYAEFSTPTGINDGTIVISGYSKGYSATNQFPFAYKVKGKNNVSKRKVTFQLSQGQVVYIHIVNAYAGSKGKKFTCKMKIQ